MTIFERISSFFHKLISSFLNEDDDMDVGAIEGDLTEYVESLNKGREVA